MRSESEKATTFLELAGAAGRGGGKKERGAAGEGSGGEEGHLQEGVVRLPWSLAMTRSQSQYCSQSNGKTKRTFNTIITEDTDITLAMAQSKSEGNQDEPNTGVRSTQIDANCGTHLGGLVWDYLMLICRYSQDRLRFWVRIGYWKELSFGKNFGGVWERICAVMISKVRR